MSFFGHLFYGYFLQFDTLPIWLLHLKIPSTHDSLIFLFFVLFIKIFNKKYFLRFSFSDGKEKEKWKYLQAIIIYCLTTHATIFFLRFFCNLRICVNPSILCTYSWSNTFQIPTQKRVVQQIHFSFYLHYFVWLPIMNFLLQKKFCLNFGIIQWWNITIYGYFSPYFQGHCSPFANSFFHAYQNETNFAWSSSPRGITIKYQTWVFDLFFVLMHVWGMKEK